MYKALVVDDEVLERRVMKKVITEQLKEVRLVGEASNGKEAIELVAEKEPDIILMDIKMPKMDGLEATKKIVDNFPNIKTVIITAYNEFDYAQQAIKYGAVDYLLKPVKLEKIVGILTSLIKNIEEERLYDHLLRQSKKESEESIHFHEEFFAEEKKLYELVREGRMEKVDDFVEQLLVKIENQDYPLVKFKIRIIEFLVSLSRTINQEAEIEICHFYFEGLLKEAKEINSVNQLTEWITKKLELVIRRVTNAYDEMGSNVIQKTTNYIKQNYDQKLTLEKVATAVHLNPSYLSHVFKEETGSNFTDYLTEVRLKKAAELLKNSKNSITNIANQVGYQNASYFSQVFKKEFDLTPTQYRKENKIE